MNQLYFTSCRQKRSLNGQSGFQTRAATPGFEPARVRAATAYVGYKLPDTFLLTADVVSRAPVRLALLDTPELGRVLLHSVYVGQEGQGTRGGNFFTHLIADLPTAFGLGDAAGLWGSPFWRAADGDDIDLALPEPEFPVTAALADFDPQTFVSDPRRREMLQFLFDALLLPAHAEKRIYLAAPAREVAACVSLVARALPPAMANRLTFSTYEYAPPTARALIVGADPSTDLPSTCYTGTGVGFHRGSGHKTDLGGTASYTTQVLEFMDKGRGDDVAKFAKWLTQQDAIVADAIECGVHIARKRPGNLKPEHITVALKYPRLAVKMLAFEEVVRNLTPDQLTVAFEEGAVGEALFAHSAAVERIVTLASEDAVFHLAAVPKVTKFLRESETDYANWPALSEGARWYLSGWKALSEMEVGATLDEEAMRYAGEVLARVPSGARKARVRAIVAAVAVALDAANRVNLTPQVEAAVIHLAPKNPQSVYAQLCDDFTARALELRRPAPVVALVAVGLGQCETDGLARSLGEVGKDHAAGLVRAIKAANRRLLVNALRAEAKSWKREPKAALRRLLPPPLLKRIFGSKLFWGLFVLALVVGAAGGYYKWEVIKKWKSDVSVPTPPR